MTVEQKVFDIIKYVFDVEEVTRDMEKSFFLAYSTEWDFVWDEIEENFGLFLLPEDKTKLNTIGEIIDFVEQEMKGL